jgi:beta-galactosidase
VSYDSKVKKDAFYLYKATWSAEPVLHLADKRLTNRASAKQTIHAYSNLDSCELMLNGQKMGQGRRDGAKAHFIWEVTLAPGENSLAIAGTKNGKRFEDKSTIYLGREAGGAR